MGLRGKEEHSRSRYGTGLRFCDDDLALPIRVLRDALDLFDLEREIAQILTAPRANSAAMCFRERWVKDESERNRAIGGLDHLELADRVRQLGEDDVEENALDSASVLTP